MALMSTRLCGHQGCQVLLTQFEIPLRLALHAAQAARQQGVLAIVNPAPAPEEPLEGLDCADILTPNETEARILLGCCQTRHPTPSGWLLPAETTGAGAVVVTVGERGIAGCDAEGTWT
jgi:ribokinase